MKRAIFLDRDGVICKERNLFYNGEYLTRPDQFEWEENSKDGLIELIKIEDMLLVMVSGQSAIGKGLMTENDFHGINKPIYDLMENYGRKFDGVYFCPHEKKDRCICRKPKTGLIEQAKKELEIDLSKSFVIGDKSVDIKMGQDSGCKTILVKTGYGGRDNEVIVRPDYHARDLLDASKYILGACKNG